MHAAVIGVVHDHDVAIGQIVAELGEHGGHRLGDGAQVLRDGLGLRNHLPVAGTQRSGEIHHVLDDLRAGYPHHSVGHVVGDRVEPALDDRKRDGINLHGRSRGTRDSLSQRADFDAGIHHLNAATRAACSRMTRALSAATVPPASPLILIVGFDQNGSLGQPSQLAL